MNTGADHSKYLGAVQPLACCHKELPAPCKHVQTIQHWHAFAVCATTQNCSYLLMSWKQQSQGSDPELVQQYAETAKSVSTGIDGGLSVREQSASRAGHILIRPRLQLHNVCFKRLCYGNNSHSRAANQRHMVLPATGGDGDTMRQLQAKAACRITVLVAGIHADFVKAQRQLQFTASTSRQTSEDVLKSALSPHLQQPAEGATLQRPPSQH